ncbi:MAG: hypothetical protein WCT08_03785 [Patescibacteria group bacterium]|jgi:hypothetical protein
MNPLEAAILKTVAYFDIFSFPLTSWEIWKWLFGNKANFLEVNKALEESGILKNKLGFGNGFYFLAGRQENVSLRQERYELALNKFKKTINFIKRLVRLPFINFVAVCNTLGLMNARDESDIDLFVIVKPKHIWTVRLLAAGYAQLRKLRPVGQNRKNKFCLSFYITDDALNLQNLLYPQDPYFIYWLATLIPVYDPNNLKQKLWQENMWLQKFLPNAEFREISVQREIQSSSLSKFLEKIVGSQGFEKFAEKVEKKWLPENLKKLANQDTRVVLNERILKFHDNDRRLEFAKAFDSRLVNLGLNL